MTGGTVLAKAIDRQEASGTSGFGILAVGGAITMYHLDAVKAKHPWVKPTINQVVGIVAGISHGSYLLGFLCPNLGDAGHAIAIYRSGGKALGVKKHVYLFDPNFGEFKFSSGDFGALLKEHLAHSYGTADNDIQLLEQFLPK